MTIDLEKREYKCFEYLMPIELAGQTLKEYHRAQMVNYSEDGMCFESDVAIQPQEFVSIHVKKNSSEMPFLEPLNNFKASVRFCRKTADEDDGLYRVGVQFSQPVAVLRGLKRPGKNDALPTEGSFKIELAPVEIPEYGFTVSPFYSIEKVKPASSVLASSGDKPALFASASAISRCASTAPSSSR